MILRLINIKYIIFILFINIYICKCTLIDIKEINNLFILSNDWLELIKISVCYSIQPLIKNQYNKNITRLENIYLTNLLQNIIFSIIFLNNINSDINIYKIKIKDFIFLSLSVFLTYYQTQNLNKLITQNNITYVIPKMNILINIFSMLINIIFFNEKLSIKKINGIILIILGLNYLNK